MTSVAWLMLIIILCSVVQSIFGVGLLLFGTPLLLLAGFSFAKALFILLPCSVVMSTLQLHAGWSHLTTSQKRLPLLLVPFVVLGLWLLLGGYVAIDVRLLIGFMLLITGLLRLSTYTRNLLHTTFQRSEVLTLMMIGLIHGISNMGGALLTIFAAGRSDDKWEIRSIIAYGYLIMALAQLTVVGISEPATWQWPYLLLPLISGATYLTIGRKLFDRCTTPIFDHLLSVFIFSFSLLLIMQAWG